jgi:hypothetical protein
MGLMGHIRLVRHGNGNGHDNGTATTRQLQRLLAILLKKIDNFTLIMLYDYSDSLLFPQWLLMER